MDGWAGGWIGKSVKFPEFWVAFRFSWSECGEGLWWQVHRFMDHQTVGLSRDWFPLLQTSGAVSRSPGGASCPGLRVV